MSSRSGTRTSHVRHTQPFSLKPALQLWSSAGVRPRPLRIVGAEEPRPCTHHARIVDDFKPHKPWHPNPASSTKTYKRLLPRVTSEKRGKRYYYCTAHALNNKPAPRNFQTSHQLGTLAPQIDALDAIRDRLIYPRAMTRPRPSNMSLPLLFQGHTQPLASFNIVIWTSTANGG